MRNNTDYTEIIEKYLDGELTGEELENFQKALESDEELAPELKLHEDIQKAISQTDVIELRENIAKTIQNAGDGKKRISIRNTWLVAASVIVLTGTTLAVWFIMNGSGSNEKLFSMYYYTEEAPAYTRSGAGVSGKIFENAMQLYENRKYEKAIPEIKKVLEKDKDNFTARFFLGMSFIETSQLDDAIIVFKGIIDHNDNLYLDKAAWYLGLCYLRSGEKDKALKKFQNIIDSKSFYANKAEKILKEL